MALPTSQNEVTTRKLADTISGLWGKIKDTFATKASPALTGTPTAPTAAAGTNTTQIATTAFVKTATTNMLAEADAMLYKGSLAGGSTGNYGALTPAADKGHTYKVTTAGKIDGVTVKVGDMLICNTDSTAAATSSNYATIKANWDFVQVNSDGAVIGPSSAVSGNIAVFDGTTGNLIKDGGALGSAAFKDVPTSGNASNAQVVMGNDSRLSNARIPTAHTHGHISDAGVLNDQTVLPANGDYLVMTDASMNDEVVRSSIGFDGSTTTKCLTQKGTFENFSTLAIGTTSSTAAAGNHNHDSVYFKSSGNVTLVSGSATKIGTSNGSDVKLTLPTIPAAANNGNLKIQLNGGTATSKFTANQSGDSTLTFATGSSDGTIAVDGTNVSVKGLGSAAYTASTAYAPSSLTSTVNNLGNTVQGQGSYISGLRSLVRHMSFPRAVYAALTAGAGQALHLYNMIPGGDDWEHSVDLTIKISSDTSSLGKVEGTVKPYQSGRTYYMRSVSSTVAKFGSSSNQKQYTADCSGSGGEITVDSSTAGGVGIDSVLSVFNNGSSVSQLDIAGTVYLRSKSPSSYPSLLIRFSVSIMSPKNSSTAYTYITATSIEEQT